MPDRQRRQSGQSTDVKTAQMGGWSASDLGVTLKTGCWMIHPEAGGRPSTCWTPAGRLDVCWSFGRELDDGQQAARPARPPPPTELSV